jgi:hypothetical protein
MAVTVGRSLDERGQRVCGAERFDNRSGDTVAGLRDTRPGRPREEFLDREEVVGVVRDRGNERVDCRIVQSEQGHEERAFLK